jgi:hypothetical protein
MATSGRGLLGWTEQRWTAVEEAARKALARTAKCRQVIPIGAEQIGAKGVVIPTIAPAGPIAYGPYNVASPIQIYADANLDDEYADDDAAIFQLVETAAAQLGVEEDLEVIQGPAGPPAGPLGGRTPRNPGLSRATLNNIVAAPPPIVTSTAIGAAGAAPNATQIVTAVRTAKGELETAGRPGPCGLLLHPHLFATLADLAPGGAPYVQHVERLIDSSEITGTSALDGSNVVGQVCGILFRLEPPAADLVQTARSSITPLGRAGGLTNLRVEEDIVVRILDQLAIHHIVY